MMFYFMLKHTELTTFCFTMFVTILFIFHAMSAAFCQDIEVEGVLKIGRDLLKILDRNDNIAKKLILPQYMASKGNLPTWPQNNLKLSVLRTSSNLVNEKYINPLEEFTLYLQNQAKETFEKMGKQILHDLDLSHKNITSLVKPITDDYVATLQNYYNFIKVDEKVPLIENDFLYLDMLETSCQLLHSEHKKLLNNIVMDNKIAPENKAIQAINNKIEKYMIVEKKQKLNHICVKYEVCREYTTFTDRCGDLISQLLKLSDVKLKDFIKILWNIVKKHDDVLELAVAEQDRKLILTKLDKLSRDIFRMREFLAILRAVISKKFKIISDTDKNEKIRIIATRILFDIIDKALNADENVLAIDFDKTILAINGWSDDKTEDVDSLPEFVDNMLKTFKNKINKNVRKEIKVLIKTILGGHPNDMTFEYLFTYGSKYVKGNDFTFETENDDDDDILNL